MCCRCRAPLEPGLKLAITLRYLATGASYRDLAFAFRVAHNTISLFIPEVCQAIFEEYQAEMWNTPQTPDEWRPVAEGFRDKWNFPHAACGAIDGKHIAITKPAKTGSLYYNFKGFFSIVMLAVVDANYKFIWADVGAPGSSSDAGIFNRSRLEPALRLGTLGLPLPEPFPNDDRYMPGGCPWGTLALCGASWTSWTATATRTATGPQTPATHLTQLRLHGCSLCHCCGPRRGQPSSSWGKFSEELRVPSSACPCPCHILLLFLWEASS